MSHLTIQLPTQIPNDLEITQIELDHLNEISEQLFKELNENHPLSLRLSSDQILVLYILIQRQLPGDPTLKDILPIITTINFNPNNN